MYFQKRHSGHWRLLSPTDFQRARFSNYPYWGNEGNSYSVINNNKLISLNNIAFNVFMEFVELKHKI